MQTGKQLELFDDVEYEGELKSKILESTFRR
jgi:hypothetical protein